MRLSYRAGLAAMMLALAIQTAQAAPQSTVSHFSLDPTAFDLKHAASYGMMYFPKRVDLSTEKPAGIVREPHYIGTPKYGVLRLGDGPKSEFTVILDETPDRQQSRLYVDLNQNGDLTDDGDGSWAVKDLQKNDRIVYRDSDLVFPVSYGTADHETARARYTLTVYHVAGTESLFYFRASARVGTVVLGGKPHRAVLVENDSDGVYYKPVDDDGRPLSGSKPGMPIWLLVDAGDVGKVGLGSTVFDIRGPFVYKGHNYEAIVSPDGSRVDVHQTTRAVVDLNPKREETPVKVLASGASAPDFAAETLDGATVKLSDFKGKVVVLDFWATWCGPCNASMPHLQTVYDRVKDGGVQVFAVCVSDGRPEFRSWVKERSSALKFQFAYDPNGTGKQGSVAKNLYGVDGIPTTFVIDRDGKVAASIVGFSGEHDKRIEDALKKLGVTVASASG